MRRHRFPLEPVLRVRRLQEDAARAGLVAATGALAGVEEALGRSLDRYHAVAQAGGPQAAPAWLAGRGSLERTAATVMADATARERSRREVAARRVELLDARSRVGALERLADRRRDEHALAARRAEDAEVDELVTTRHGRAR